MTRTVESALHTLHHQLELAPLYYGHGTDNAWDEAVCLIFHVMNIPIHSDQTVLKKTLKDEEWEKIMVLAQARIHTQKPLPYLIHRAWFAGLEFYVDERVLIPRSPLSELIEQRFEPWISPGNVHRILDLCTGSGCIAIACAHYFSKAHVDASDLSKDALAVAEKNISHYQLQNQVHLIPSDLFDNIQGQYDVIISNPPYVDAEDMSTLPNEYRHEPDFALKAGPDGLACVRRILQQATHYLTPQGILVVEVGNSADALIEAFPTLPFMWLEFSRGGTGVFTLTREELLPLL